MRYPTYAQYTILRQIMILKMLTTSLVWVRPILVGHKYQLFPRIPLDGLPYIKCFQDPTPLRRLKNWCHTFQRDPEGSQKNSFLQDRFKLFVLSQVFFEMVYFNSWFWTLGKIEQQLAMDTLLCTCQVGLGTPSGVFKGFGERFLRILFCFPIIISLNYQLSELKA